MVKIILVVDNNLYYIDITIPYEDIKQRLEYDSAISQWLTDLRILSK